jgi:ubiquinone/menaquinone biosynthesis C-methylase UbiE
MIPFHGWLTKVDALPWEVEGIPVDPATRTRREEYHWAAERLRAQPAASMTLLDAATGYVPGWHQLPYIAAAQGWLVNTIDIDHRTLHMPAHPLVKRELGDLLGLPYPDNSFDVVACISVLEHLSASDREVAAAELVRVARHALILTADESPGLAELFERHGCDVGLEKPTPEACIHLSPPVYACYAHKLKVT